MVSIESFACTRCMPLRVPSPELVSSFVATYQELGMYSYVLACFQGLCVYLHVSACVCMYQMLGVYVHTLRAGQCKHISRAGHVFSCVGTYQKLRV